MAMTKIEASQISRIDVHESSKNLVLIIFQINTNTPIVVKSEEIRERNNVGAMLEYHATLFSKLRALPFNTERLTLEEINQLKSCNPSKITGGLYSQQTWKTLLDTKMLHSGTDPKSVIKITYIEQLANLLDLCDKKLERQKLRESLLRGQTNVVYELGQILAIDFFIGNGDRFEDEDKIAFPRGSIKGTQNIFFQFRNEEIHVTGIDTYDSGNLWSDMNNTIEQLEQRSMSGTWPGRILSPGATKAREASSEAAVSSLIKIAFEGDTGQGGLKGWTNVGPETKKALVTVFHKGISDGKKILRSKYNLTDNLAGLQPGIRSRWNIIRG